MRRLPQISVSGDVQGDFVVLARRARGVLTIAPSKVADEAPIVTSLRRTCLACPSQWDGTLDDGRVLYARYRHGELSVGVGETKEEAVRNSWPKQALLCEHVGDALEGFMTFEDLRTRLYGLVDFAPNLEVEGEERELVPTDRTG